MIARLFGRIADKQPSRLIVDVAGVGYDVQVPLSTYYVTSEVGGEMALRIHTHVREDQLSLYGFATDLELMMFEKLIAVSGIGPKVALSVLSGIEPRDLAGAIRRNDLARLTAIPGVGRKTAERMVLELKDRLAQLAVPAGAVMPMPDSPGERLRTDLLSALQNLGYHRPLAEKAIDAIATADSTFEQALRSALRELMR